MTVEVVEVKEEGIVDVVEGNRVTVISVGVQGPAGADGAGADVNIISHNFSWGDATPANVGDPIPANKLIRKVTIFIKTAFNGVGASLQVGVVGNVGQLMASTYNDPTEASVYESNPALSYGSSTQVILTITPGAGASQGSGQVVIEAES